MLNLKWDDMKNESESFKVTSTNNKIFKFTNSGLLKFNEALNYWISSNDVLPSILDNTCNIIQPNWKPSLNEYYYVPAFVPQLHLIKTYQGIKDFYLNNDLYYSTPEEAIKVMKNMLKYNNSYINK